MAEPDPRVTLALERTLLAWTRTALALMAFGFVVGRLAPFLRASNPESAGPWEARWIGLVVVLLGGLVQAGALVEHARSIRRLRSGQSLPLRILSPATLLGTVLTILAGVVAIYIGTL